MHRGFTLFPLIFLILAFPGTLQAQTEEKPYVNSHFIRVDTILLHYRDWNGNLAHPKGKVLLIHGFIGSTYCWRMNVEALADGESGGTLINCYLNVSSLGGTYPPSSVVFCGGCKILSAYSYSNRSFCI